ncbi:hypothetical protein TWF694_011355 [Orbilia ellipsospora]|uniref:Uncharacterized protein n=1 Tax=Orbilia ellipsospora TaxID=2528407 RepID=A0AAV9X507_9PEZI
MADDGNNIGLQAEITNVPIAAISILRSVLPLIQALSADNVSPFALGQLELIGRSFPISGALARRTPDILTRSNSYRLRNLQLCIGWRRGDAAWTLAETVGGQAAALLSVALVELFCRNSAGEILYHLSERILPRGQQTATMAQLADLAETLANKMQKLTFGEHLKFQIDRIQKTYLNLGTKLSSDAIGSLLDRLTVESVVELLDAVQVALRDEDTVLYIEGFQGMGAVVGLLMGLCPGDIALFVENGVIFQGLRRSIIISIMHSKPFLLSKEKIVRGSKISMTLPSYFRPNEFLRRPGRMSDYDRITVRTEGCLGEMVRLVFDHVTFKPKDHVINCFASLVGAAICSFNSSDFMTNSKFPETGLRSLLGSSAKQRVQEKLSTYFGTDVDCTTRRSLISQYEELRQAISLLAPNSACQCTLSPGMHSWADQTATMSSCWLRSIWESLRAIFGYAILMTFLDTKCEALRIVQDPNLKAGNHFSNCLIRHINSQRDVPMSLLEVKSEYSVSDLHIDICRMFGMVEPTIKEAKKIVGVSNGAVSIFPSTLETLSHDAEHLVSYTLADGQYYDGRMNYRALVETDTPDPRQFAEKSLQPPREIDLSGSGAHSQVVMSVKGFHNSLCLRTVVHFRDSAIVLSFHAAHMAYMSSAIAPPCSHPSSGPVVLSDKAPIIATGVSAPCASDDRIAVVLTHGNSEAQFLAGVTDVPTLFQGNCCLDCVIRTAQSDGYKLLIQS